MPTPPTRTLLDTAVGAGVALGLAACFLATAPAHAGSDAPLPFPANPSGIAPPGPVGSQVDDATGYQGQVSCASNPLPGTARLRDLVLSTYGQGYDGGTIRSCSSGGASEHKDGRAWDWMLDVTDKRERQAAADFLGWLTAPGRDGTPAVMARRLGVMYVIYNRKMWSSYTGVWRDYSGYNPHTDHIHISLSWNGARGNVSFWTGRTWATDYGTCQVFTESPATIARPEPRTRPCADPVVPARPLDQPMLWLGSTGDAVSTAQRLLGVPASGSFTRETRDRVLGYQRRHDLPTTGAVDRATWGSLKPRAAVPSTPSWTPAQAGDWGRDEAGSPRLHAGSAGVAVTALQAALGLRVIERTGYFGRRTRSLVGVLKESHGLNATAVVTPKVWRVLPSSHDGLRERADQQRQQPAGQTAPGAE